MGSIPILGTSLRVNTLQSCAKLNHYTKNIRTGVYIFPMKFTRLTVVLAIFLPLALSGCSSNSSGEDSDEYKMNQYYECVERYADNELYTTDQIMNICYPLKPPGL